MISFVSHGDFTKTKRFIGNARKVIKMDDLDIMGRLGVKVLQDATPKDTGLTAASWDYNIVRKNDQVIIEFVNRNVVDGVCVAIVLQYGHGTRNGGYVQGIDYINPALRPIFNEIIRGKWKELIDG